MAVGWLDKHVEGTDWMTVELVSQCKLKHIENVFVKCKSGFQ